MATTIFSSIDDFRAIVPQVHKNFPFEKELEPIIKQAADKYIAGFMGDEYANLLEDFLSDPNGMQPYQNNLLPNVRNPLAWYTYFEALTSNAVHLGSMGVTESRSTDGTAGPAQGWAKK